MKHVGPAIRLFIFMTGLTGLVYPALVTGIAQSFFYDQANGSVVGRSGVIIGSSLVAQNFTGPNYFWPRPSAADFNPLPSAGTNQGPISAALKTTFEERKEKLKMAHPEKGEPPQDLLFSSGSGLDPEISVVAARYQIERIAKARGIKEVQLVQLVDKLTKGRQIGILGEPRVNVLLLNLALDEAQEVQ